MISIREAKKVHVDYAEVLRQSPVAHAPKAMEHLSEFLKSSQHAFVGYVDNDVACVYGFISPSLMSDRAYLWLLTTKLVEENKFLFIRHSQMCIEQALKYYETVVGDVALGDDRAKRWLMWLGAKFGEPNTSTQPFFITKSTFEGRRWTQ